MIEIGDEFDVNGNLGIVCFKGIYYNQDYICIAFEKENKFEIYKVKYKENKVFVAEEKNQEKYAYVLSNFVTDNIVENKLVDKTLELLNQINNNSN